MRKIKWILISIIVTTLVLFPLLETHIHLDENILEKNNIVPQKSLNSVSNGDNNNWPMFGHDPQHTGYSSSTAPNTNNVLWSYTTEGDVLSSPIVAQDKLFVGSYDHNIYCLNAYNGSLIWKYATDGLVEAAPAFYNGNIYIGSYDRYIYCLDAQDGDQIWSYHIGGFLSSSPTVYNDRVYVGSWNNNIYCLDAQGNGDGTTNLLWSNMTGGAIRTSPAIENDLVFIGSFGNIYCYNAENGNLIWNKSTGGQSWVSSTTASDDKIYVNMDNENLYCFEATTGDELWIYPIGDSLWAAPAIANGKIYIGSLENVVFCVDAAGGGLLWRHPLEGAIQSSPSVADEKVYIGCEDGKVYCLDANGNEELKTTTEYWTYTTDESIYYSSPAIAYGNVYIGSSDDTIYCFGLNEPPGQPEVPIGVTNGETGIEYFHSVEPITDPDGDTVYYLFDWGDGTDNGWIQTTSASHIWNEEGSYNIKVKAKDVYDAESDWSDPLVVAITEGAQDQLRISITPSSVRESEEFYVTVTLVGNPVEKASVEFLDNTYYTDSNGRVYITAPDVSEDIAYTITANFEDYDPVSTSVSILDIPQTAQGLIYGKVTDLTGVALEDTSVCILLDGSASQCTLTDEQGLYHIFIPMGTYSVRVSKTGYVTATINNFEAGDPLGDDLYFALEKSDEEPLPDENQELINDAINNGYVGAEINYKEDEHEETRYFTTEITINPLEIEENKLSISINGDEEIAGKTLIFNLPDSFNFQDRIIIEYDGKEISLADSVRDVLDPNNDGLHAEYRIIKGEDKDDADQILVSIPHFSEHTITITSVIEAVSIVTIFLLYILVGIVAFFIFFGPGIGSVILRKKRLRKLKR